MYSYQFPGLRKRPGHCIRHGILIGLCIYSPATRLFFALVKPSDARFPSCVRGVGLSYRYRTKSSTQNLEAVRMRVGLTSHPRLQVPVSFSFLLLGASHASGVDIHPGRSEEGTSPTSLSTCTHPPAAAHRSHTKIRIRNPSQICWRAG